MDGTDSFQSRVKKALVWRSGTQIFSQLVAWGSTLAVIRILDPSDYGIFAMTQVILAFLSFLNGYGFASSIIQSEEVKPIQIRQAFGMLLLLNATIAIIQLILAPFAAEFYGQPIVADLLYVQALIYLATPFMVLPEAIMTRDLEFKRPAIVNIISALTAASVALFGALSGWGVWTLVIAPLSGFWMRAICLMVAARFWVWPSFDFRGAGSMFNFGFTLLISHLCWVMITQSDIFIAARFVDPHQLGLYAEALFLTTIISSKFVPPLNEVAFPAYSRIQSDLDMLSTHFLKAVRLILLVTCPIYLGLAVTAEPLVAVVLGQKWIAMAPYVSILALAMPIMTIHILFAPAVNAVGKPNITARASLFGALIMPVAFFIGIQWGITAMAWAWVIIFPAVPLYAFFMSRKLIGIDAPRMVRAIAPGILSSILMALIVYIFDRSIPISNIYIRLPILVALGGISYVGLLYVRERETLQEIINLVIKRQPPETLLDQESSATS